MMMIMTKMPFAELLGITLSTSHATHWSMRNTLIPAGNSSYDILLCVWITLLDLMIVWEPLSKFLDVVTLFQQGLIHLLCRGYVITNQIVCVPSSQDAEDQAVQQ